MTLREADRTRLLREIQSGVPLEPRPFAALGEGLGLTETAVLEQLRACADEGVLREISAVLEGSALGYESALVAGAVAESDLERVVKVVNAHPTVTHDYLRNHAYNLWFTLAVPHRMGLDDTLELLAREARVERFHALRRTATFKIGVRFDPQTLANDTRAPTEAPQEPVAIDVSPQDERLFRALQTPLPLVPDAFDELARAAGVDARTLLDFGRRHLGGAVRRYVGTLRHRKLGVRANGMVVWKVDEADVDEAGRRLASSPEVSHCYARSSFEGFPYRLYSMVHGPDRDSCLEVARQLSIATGLDDYAVLFSEREFKKTRLRYFLPELDQWWEARAAHGIIGTARRPS